MHLIIHGLFSSLFIYPSMYLTIELFTNTDVGLYPRLTVFPMFNYFGNSQAH